MFFKRAMEAIIRTLDFANREISTTSRSWQIHGEQHRHENLRQVSWIIALLVISNFALINEYGVLIEPNTLDFIVNRDGWLPKPNYIPKIMDVPEPKNQTALLRFLGMINFLAQFIPQIHVLLATLHKYRTKAYKGRSFSFDDRERAAFEELKRLAKSTDYLAHPDLSKPFHIFTDASQLGIGAMLAQEDSNGIFHPIQYMSKSFFKKSTKLACVWARTFLCHCRCGKMAMFARFWSVHCSHWSSQFSEFVLNLPINSNLAKCLDWAIRLQDYSFKCQYIQGR